MASLASAKPLAKPAPPSLAATCQSALPDRPSVTISLESHTEDQKGAKAALAPLCARREALRRCYGKGPPPAPAAAGSAVRRVDDPRGVPPPADAPVRGGEVSIEGKGRAAQVSVAPGTLWPGEAACIKKALTSSAPSELVTAEIVLGPAAEQRAENDMIYTQCSQLETWSALASVTVSAPAAAGKKAASVGKAACAALPALARCANATSGQITLELGRGAPRPSADPMFSTSLDEAAASCVSRSLAKLPRLGGAAFRVQVELGLPSSDDDPPPAP